MTKNGKITKISLGILLLISIASVLMRCIAILKYYNPQNGHFESKSLINVANVLVITAIVTFLISAFFGSKKEALRFDFTSPASLIPSGLLTIAIAFLGASIAIRAYAGHYSAALLNEQPDLLTVLETVIAILSLLATIYLISGALQRHRHSTARGMLGLCTAIFFAAYATYLYFDPTLPINAPNKLVDQMAYLFTAVFFLFETRISLGRELWRPYVTTGLIASILNIYASIPSAIAFFAKNSLVSNSIFDFALTFFVAIYALMRVYQYSMLKKDEESDFIFALRSQADDIEERISIKEEAERLEYIDLINKIGKETAILRAEEAAIAAKAAREAEEAKRAAREAEATLGANDDNYFQESLFDSEEPISEEAEDKSIEAVDVAEDCESEPTEATNDNATDPAAEEGAAEQELDNALDGESVTSEENEEASATSREHLDEPVGIESSEEATEDTDAKNEASEENQD